jgi:hypothetical protein
VLRTSLGPCGAVAPQDFGTSGRGAVARGAAAGGGGDRWWISEVRGDHAGHFAFAVRPKQGMIFIVRCVDCDTGAPASLVWHIIDY